MVRLSTTGEEGEGEKGKERRGGVTQRWMAEDVWQAGKERGL